MRPFFVVTIIALICLSCNLEQLPSLKFNGGKDYLRLDSIVNRNHDFRCFGSYTYGKDVIASNYMVDSKFHLIMVELDSVDADYKISHVSNHAYSPNNSFYGIVPGEDFELKYNIMELSGIKNINSLKLSSDGVIREGTLNDTLKEYHVSFKNFSIDVNENINNRMHAEALPSMSNNLVEAEIIFLTKGNKVYLFVMNNSRGEDKSIEKGTLYKYLFH